MKTRLRIFAGIISVQALGVLYRFKKAWTANSHHHAPRLLVELECHEVVGFGAKHRKRFSERPNKQVTARHSVVNCAIGQLNIPLTLNKISHKLRQPQASGRDDGAR